ncbi:MAG: xanthine dehydrogenase family protein molybdopterin-binding subunit [Rhodothermales bacterium]
MADPRSAGALRYAQDLEMEGMLHARVLRSPYAHARIVRIDTSSVPDSVVVLTRDDIRDLNRYGCQIQDETVVAVDEALFAGAPVVAVAAATRREADEALQYIDVDYDELPAVFNEMDAIAPGAPLVHPRHYISENDAAYFGMRPIDGTNICHRFRIRHGDIDAGFAGSDVIVEEVFTTDSAAHVPMEPHASLARWHDGRLEVWTGNQTPFNLRMDLAGIFGLKPEQVRIVVPPLGGSFGAKTFVRTEAIAAALARKAGRPVKIVLERAEEWQTMNRHPATLWMKIGAKRDGTLVAKHVMCWANTGAHADSGPGVAQKMGYASPGPYRIPNVWVDSHCVYTNTPPNGAYRGYGQMQCIWASERLMDMLAHKLGMDPLELRLKNILREGDTYCTGETMHDVAFEECLRRSAEAIGWDSSDDHRGKGLCVLMKGMQTPSRASIGIEKEDDGTYTIRCATIEMGQGARPAIRQMAAELLGVPMDRVTFPDPDTDIVPYDTRTTSSRSTHVMSRALVEAVRALELDGRKGVGEVTDKGGLNVDTGQGIASSHWHQGAAGAVVDVDRETGKLHVRHIHASIYAGKVVSRPAAELQNEGSMIMGLGTALFEAIQFDGGQVTNANLSDYNVPSFHDLPRITHDLVEREGAQVYGLGETALPPVPAAIGNALASQGIHQTALPMTAERVIHALDGGDGPARLAAVRKLIETHPRS